MIYKETENKFISDFRKYMSENETRLSKATVTTYVNDARSQLRGDRGYDIWLVLTDEKLLENLKIHVKDSWEIWGNIYSESSTAANGNNAVLGLQHMFNFLNQEKHREESIIEETKATSKMVAQYISDSYGKLTEKEVCDYLSVTTGHSSEFFIAYYNDYKYLVGDLEYSDELNPDTLYYFLDSLNDKQLINAQKYLQDYLKNSYENRMRIYPFRYEEYNEYFSSRGLSPIFNIKEIALYEPKVNHDLTETFWILHKKGNQTVEEIINSNEWVNDNDRFKKRVKFIPKGAQFVFVENINIEDEYAKFFDKGIKIIAKGTLEEQSEDGIYLHIIWDKELLNKIWYRDQFTADFAMVKSGRKWLSNNLVNFINGNEEQDMERYIKAYGKKQSKVEIFEETISSSDNNLINTDENSYSKEDFLSEVFISESEYETISSLLSNKKNLILQGAPGVGKTFMAKRLAYSRVGKITNVNVKQIQFHQSYSYEDLIMGYRPTESGFELKTGPFYDFCKLAELDPDEDSEYYFIIDEINRGNISKIFGELLMLIEHDKRGPSHSIRLMYSDEDFFVPKNVFIIGLMNTADRSLAVLDYALRRRFAFYTLKPGFDNRGFKEMLEISNNIKLRKLVNVVSNLNEEIIADDSLGNGFEIGHSYFTVEEEKHDAYISNIIEYELIPLVSEYWYDDPSKIESYSELLRAVMYE